jgi:type II secretory pathway pseudopilin PulG
VPFCFSWQVSTSLPANFSDANDDDDDEYLNILVEDGWANDDEDDDYYYYEDEYGLAPAAAPAFDKQQQRQQAVMLAQQVAQLQQQQLRPLHRPAVSPNLRSPAASNMSNDAADDFEELDPMAVRKSDIGLTPAEMAALLEYANDQQDQGSGFRKPVSAPVLNPRLGYSFSSMGRQAAASLAAAVATGQLKDPLLLRPPVKPGGSPGMFLLYNFENIHKIYIYLITNMYTCITVIYCETSLLLAGFPGSESCHDSENHICKVH